MDIQFNSLRQEKDHIGVIFCDQNCRLIGFGKKLDQISKKYISNILSADESFKLRNSKNFDYVTIHQPESLKFSKLHIFKLTAPIWRMPRECADIAMIIMPYKFSPTTYPNHTAALVVLNKYKNRWWKNGCI